MGGGQGVCASGERKRATSNSKQRSKLVCHLSLHNCRVVGSICAHTTLVTSRSDLLAHVGVPTRNRTNQSYAIHTHAAFCICILYVHTVSPTPSSSIEAETGVQYIYNIAGTPAPDRKE